MAAAVVVGVSTSAQASTVSCPDTLFGREFTLTTSTDSICRASGNGNGYLNGNAADFDSRTWALLDNSDSPADLLENALTIIGIGQFSGTFDIAPAVWGTYSRIILAFQTAPGGLNPDWAAFELINSVNGDWSIQGGTKTLDHANLYGITREGGIGVTAVPEPASLMLLGAGLALGAHRLRRKK